MRGGRRRPYKLHDGPGGYSRCRACGAPIRWLLTPLGRLMPSDAAAVGADETHFDHTRHTSHFASCRQADMWRKPWAKEKGAPEGAP